MCLLLEILYQAVVVVGFELSLVLAKVVEVIGLNSEVGSDDILLEEPASEVERVESSPIDVFYILLNSFLVFPFGRWQGRMPDRQLVEIVKS